MEESDVEIEPPAKKLKFENTLDIEVKTTLPALSSCNFDILNPKNADSTEQEKKEQEVFSNVQNSSSLSLSLDSLNSANSIINNVVEASSQNEKEETELENGDSSSETESESPESSKSGPESPETNELPPPSGSNSVTQKIKTNKSIKLLKVPISGKKNKSSHHRRNIKDILKSDALGEETLAAQREEAERRHRIQQQQLKLKLLAQQHQQLMQESGIDPNDTNSNGSSGSLEDIVSKIAQRKHLTLSIGTEEINKGFINHHAPSDILNQSLIDCEEEIVLSSDEEDHPPQRNKLLNQMLDQESYSRNDVSSSTGRFGHFGGSMMRTSSQRDNNIISLSSEEDESSVEMSTSRLHPSLLMNRQIEERIGDRKIPEADEDSDDDCIVLSPCPEEDEVDKDEKNQDELNVPDEFGRVLVNVGHPEEDPDIFLPPQISRIVKPHQIGGIRFLYDNVVESVERFDTSSGFGCILAHSMGLGKSIQTVSFCDVFLRASKGKTVLIIVPINTIQNWVNEFNMWLPVTGLNATSSNKTKKRRNKNGKVFSNGQSNPPNIDLPSSTKSSFSNNDLNDSVSETVSLNLTFDSTLNLSDMINIEDSETNKKSEDSLPEPTTAETSDTEVDDTLEVHHRSFNVFLLNETVKTLQAREKTINEWSTKGGVLLIGYEMYRMLALKKLKKSTRKQPQQSFLNNFGSDQGEAETLNRIHTCLVNPGPDLVICDEGHRIKNSGASISQALKAIRTRRRVVLTGYPLQNNLMEYWCMVDFIRPNYLGSKVEFSNMFERPISNAQCVDSTFEDRRLMRYRSHVLHSLLEGFVQRRSHAVLQSALPQKQEWVFLLKMTPVQYKLYTGFIKYLSENLEGQSAANPIKAFAVCCKIWNHPDALYNVVKKKQSILDDLDLDEVTVAADGSAKPKAKRGQKDKSKDSQTPQDQLAFFDGSGFNFPRSHYGSYGAPGTNSSGRSDQALSLDWATPIFQNYEPGVLENGVKFEILFEIIKETITLKDKLLVFSQSLLSLDLIEIFLAQKFQWNKNHQYYRLDGSTTGLERERLVNNFNAKPDVFVFLVSTRAGSLGINLTGANRVVVLDASWNPCHDCQAVCRIYRYGQTKPCQIYRFVSDCTLEKRIYDRQINKRGMSDRVVDEMNPNAQFKTKDVSSFLVLKHEHLDKLPFITWDFDPEKYCDPALQNVLHRVGHKLTQEPFEHESLLIDQKSQRLSATEKRLAHRNYLNEKRTASQQTSSGYTYTRPSYAAFYPKETPSSTPTNTNTHPKRAGAYGSSLTNYRQFQLSNDDRFEQHVTALRAKGICVQNIILKKDAFLADPSGGPDMFIMTGEKIYVLRSEKGTYLRISNGKLIAIRNNTANSRVPGMTVPANQELTKEQLQGLVYSFLKIPGHSSFDPNSTATSPYPPTEQPLPPSPNYFSQSRNHLQVTNSRNNSGGDVTVWQDQDGLHKNSYTESGIAKASPNFENVSRGSGSSGMNPFHNSNLERLSYLTNQFPGFSRPEYGFQSSRSNSSPLSQNFDSSRGLQSTPLYSSNSQHRLIGNDSPSGPELEVIAIAKSSSSIRSNKSSSNDSDSYSRSYLTSKKRNQIFDQNPTYPVESRTLERNHKDPIVDMNPSFYKDFTITVKSTKNGNPSNQRESSSSSSIQPHESSIQSQSLTGRHSKDFRSGLTSSWIASSPSNNDGHFQYNTTMSNPSSFENTFASNFGTSQQDEVKNNVFSTSIHQDFPSNSSQYYISGSNSSNGNNNVSSSVNNFEDHHATGSKSNIPVHFPYQEGV